METKANIPVIDAAAADLAGIGDVVRLPDGTGRRPDFENEIIRFFGRLGVIEAATAVEFGICAYRKRPFRVDRLEQHRSSRELLVAVDEAFIMPVAPNIAGEDRPDLSRAFALRVRRSEGVIFARGVWHAVPYPLKDESFALVGFALGTSQDDMFFHDLAPALRMLV